MLCSKVKGTDSAIRPLKDVSIPLFAGLYFQPSPKDSLYSNLPQKSGGGDLFETSKTGSPVDGRIFYFWLTSQPLALLWHSWEAKMARDGHSDLFSTSQTVHAIYSPTGDSSWLTTTQS